MNDWSELQQRLGKEDTILVTGGCGFLGRSLVSLLHKELAVKIRVLDMATSPLYPSEEEAAIFRSARVEVMRGDVSKGADVERAVAGVCAVFHTASVLQFHGHQFADSFRINVDGTQLLLDAARRQPTCRCFIYTSTTCVVFDGHDVTWPHDEKDEKQSDDHKRDDDDDVDGDEDVRVQENELAYGGKSRAFRACPYAVTKSEAERRVLSANNPSQGFSTAAIRPANIWGPGDTLSIRFLPELSKVQVGTSDIPISATYVENASQAHLAALQGLLSKPQRVGGRPFFVTDPQVVSVRRRTARYLQQCWGIAPPRLALPVWLLVALAWLVELLVAVAFRLCRCRLSVSLTPFLILSAARPQRYSAAAARRVLGFRPVDDELAWQRTAEFVQRYRALHSFPPPS